MESNPRESVSQVRSRTLPSSGSVSNSSYSCRCMGSAFRWLQLRRPATRSRACGSTLGRESIVRRGQAPLRNRHDAVSASTPSTRANLGLAGPPELLCKHWCKAPARSRETARSSRRSTPRGGLPKLNVEGSSPFTRFRGHERTAGDRSGQEASRARVAPSAASASRGRPAAARLPRGDSR